MKRASRCRVNDEDCHWNVDSPEFLSSAEKEWALWNSENSKGFWFGLIKRKRKLLFLAGKLPTDRKDPMGHKIFIDVVIEAESGLDRHQLVILTANLLKGTNVRFICDWLDRLALVLENEKTDFPSWEFYETKQEWETFAGRFQCQSSNMQERMFVAERLESLEKSHREYVVANIHFSVDEFFGKVCSRLAKSAVLTIFSSMCSGKEELPNDSKRFFTLGNILLTLIVLCLFGGGMFLMGIWN